MTSPACIDDSGMGRCRAPFRAENIGPSAKLTALQIPLRPTDSSLFPLASSRDRLPGHRTAHALLLTYKFSVSEAGKYKPILHMLNRHVHRLHEPSHLRQQRLAQAQPVGFRHASCKQWLWS